MCFTVAAGDAEPASVPMDSIRQWLQLINDEHSLSSRDFLSASDTSSCRDTSTTVSVDTQRSVESMATVDRSRELARWVADAATVDNSLTLDSHAACTDLQPGSWIKCSLQFRPKICSTHIFRSL